MDGQSKGLDFSEDFGSSNVKTQHAGEGFVDFGS